MSRFATSFGGRRAVIAAGIAGLAAGGAVGATVAHEVAPLAAMGSVSITRIASLGALAQPMFGATVASVRGRVVELFGDRVVVDDGSGRALIELGHVPSGLVATGQTVTVQGGLVEGGLRARFIVAANGQVVAIGPRGGPHRDRDDEGHRGGHGPRRPPTDVPAVAPPPAPAAG